MSKKVKATTTQATRKPSGYIYAEDTPAWLEWIVPESFNATELFRIVTFFVFHSPCVGTTNKPQPASAMCKPITDYGWSAKWGNYRNPNSLNYILRNSCTNFSLIYSATGNNDMQQACDKADLLVDFPHKLNVERAAISISDQNQILSLFRHIRNAFAHSRINMYPLDDGDVMFLFEDIAKRKSEGIPVSARMLLRKSTLLNWITIIEAGPVLANSEE